jgi:tetratricopeptide (TPR) repeat protein
LLAAPLTSVKKKKLKIKNIQKNTVSREIFAMLNVREMITYRIGNSTPTPLLKFKYCSKMLGVSLGRKVKIANFERPTELQMLSCFFSDLFHLGHKLVDLYPNKPVAWFAVGCYYLVIGKNEPARRYFSKATTLDRVFGPAWLAFGHSFASENEHDQAMAAYFTAAQLMKG